MTQTITVEQLKQVLDETPYAVLIDVRELHEWQAGHIAQAKHIPLAQIEQGIYSIACPKETPIYLQCRTGRRSDDAAQQLAELGYQNAINVEGGIVAWMLAGFDIESD